MKETKKILSMLMALALVLSLGAFALAEGETDSTAGSAANTAAAEALKEAEEKSQALTDALTAYSTAKQEARKQARLTSLKEELDGYVAAGSLTQEQADLLLSYYAEQLAQNNGSTGKGRGSRGMKNGMPNGQNNQSGTNSHSAPQSGMNSQNSFGRGGRHGGGRNIQVPTAPQTDGTATSPAPTGTGI